MSASIPSPYLTIGIAARGRMVPSAMGVSIGTYRLATDPIGTHSLSLTHLVIGSRITIREQGSLDVKYTGIADTTTEVIVLPVYPSGSPKNSWLVDIRKTSAFPYYQRYTTLLDVIIGTSTHYVNQLPDQR